VRRLGPLVLTICLLLPANARAAASTAWANGAIATVLAHGALPGTTPATFQPQAPLDAATLQQLVGVVKAPLVPPAPPAVPAAPVTMAALHAALVRALGLGPDASTLQRALVAAGLRPRSNAGMEVTARQLALTYDHADDGQERSPGEPATRAEAAWATARALRAKPWLAPQVQSTLGELDLALSQDTAAWPDWVVQAVGFIGSPYVWGGEWEGTDSPLGPQAHAGFDCSGLVYRVLVLQPGHLTDEDLGGRTTYAMARATALTERLAADELQAGDLVLFGDARGPSTPWSAIGHVGLSLGGEWFIHSSGQGVTIDRLTGWYASRFAYGRRPPVEPAL
jgi:cell wall-associated NlpC family hydrolase